MKIFKILKWTTVWTATWTMLMSPVAMGQEAKRVTKQQMQSVVDQMGLNRQITLGEFYAKNKHLYPPRIQKLIAPLFTTFKNQMMPSFEILSSKTTSGEEIATIRISQGSELLNIQWFGERERMLKFQNTNLSEIDVINFNDMFMRIIAGDEKYRKQIETKPAQTTSKANIKATLATKYPNVSRVEWKSMSPYDRANYVVNLRSLWQDARQVLKAKGAQKKAPKTSQNFFENNRYFFTLFFGQDAEAAKKTVTDGHKAGNSFSGDSCIVAGYVAKYEKSNSGEVCNHKVIDQVYATRDNSLYLKAQSVCATSNQIACNPYVYGTPNGAPTCVTPSLSDTNFQKATHWDGPCDSSSRLSHSEVEILNDKSKKQGRYEDGNLKSADELKELFKTEQGKDNYKLTEDYLLGILKFRGHVKADAKSIFDSGVMSEEILAQIMLDKKAFDNEISEAVKSCKTESEASKSKARVHEKNYWQACDQLNRRFTFINELFASKCEKGQTLNPNSLKCSCEAPAKNEVLPGAKCAVVNPPAPAAPTVTASADETKVEIAEDCEAKYPGATDLSNKCLCANGNAPKKDVTGEASGEESWSCESTSGKADKPGKSAADCDFMCKMWKGLKAAIPFILGGVVAYAIFKSLAPKKPTLNQPLDKCPDGSAAPCGQVCAVPLKKQANGGCSCDGCPPGQIANATTCFCTTGTSGGTTQTYLCPDSTTRVTDLSNCPTYACWNGQSYQNPLNCPPQQSTPSSTPANTGN